jgi:hypothetical protein
MNRLDISYQGQKVGTLAEARGGIFFEYDGRWREFASQAAVPTALAADVGYELKPVAP